MRTIPNGRNKENLCCSLVRSMGRQQRREKEGGGVVINRIPRGSGWTEVQDRTIVLEFLQGR